MERVRPLLRDAIRIRLVKLTNKEKRSGLGAEIPLGGSKFGGAPDIPEGFDWPYFTYNGPGFDFSGSEVECFETTETCPMSLLAQINFADVQALDTEGILPKSGILYFFYELKNGEWESFSQRPGRNGCMRVEYYDGPMEKLVRQPFPDELEEEYRIPQQALQFSVEKSLPDYEDCPIVPFVSSEGKLWEEYISATQALGYPIDNEESNEDDGYIVKMLGWADLIQCEIVSEWETNKFYGGKIPPMIKPEERKRIWEEALRWRLLLQFDSIPELPEPFGDMGRLYFYIREEDLRARRFENTRMELQCY